MPTIVEKFKKNTAKIVQSVIIVNLNQIEKALVKFQKLLVRFSTYNVKFSSIEISKHLRALAASF